MSLGSKVNCPTSAKLGGRMKRHHRIALEGFTFGKVNVTGVKSQMSIGPWSDWDET